MTYLSLRAIKPQFIQIISKPEYFRLKYTESVAILCLLIYCPLTKITQSEGKLRFTIKDKIAIQSLLEIDNKLRDELHPYKPILVREDGDYIIYLYPNNKLLEIYNSKPKSVHIQIKSIRRNTHLNTPIIYILNE